MRLPGFVNGAYQDASRIVAGELCTNVFPRPVPQGGKVRSALYPAPGLSSFATLTEAPGRGIFYENGQLFAVYGNTLYEVDSAGTPTARGDVAVDGNPVTFDHNGEGGNELLTTSGNNAYVLDLQTNTLTLQVAGAAFGGQLDGHFVVLDAATSTLKASDSLDGTSWPGTMVAQRTSASDPWVAMCVARSEIALIGEKTGEIWYNAGRSPLPFAPRPEGVFSVGIAAPRSLTRFAGSFAWLGRTEEGNPAAYFMDGYTPQKISTPGLESVFQTYEDADQLDDAIGWSYARDGHTFYVLTFTTADKTWVYDRLTDTWHERGFWDADTASFRAYRPMFHAAGWRKNLVCDRDGHRIYSLSSAIYTDVNGEELRRVRRTPHQANENKRLFFPYAELECDRGVGLEDAAAQGGDPLVALRYSNNGGNTFGASRMRNVGKLGAFDTRVRWDQCGSGRDRVWEVWSSDPVATRWFDFYVGVGAGRF